MTSPILTKIVTQHAEEAAFLWQLRDQAVVAPHYRLGDLRRLDLRLEAHLDGLRVAAEPGWKIVLEQLEANQGPGELFVAAFLAGEMDHPNEWDKVLAAAAPVPALRRAAISAMGWLPSEKAHQLVTKLLTASAANLRHTGLGGALTHRLNPGIALEKCLLDPDLSLRSHALRVVGVMGYAAWKPQLLREMRSSDLPCRFASAWSLVRLGADQAGVSELQTIVLADPRFRAAAVNLLQRRLEPSAARRLIRLLIATPDTERIAVLAAGVLGDPAEIPWLLEKMANPALARLAGESFSWITGVDLSVQNMEADPPEGFEAGPNENPLDERVDLDPDEHLPWPKSESLISWWKREEKRFRAGLRYLRGVPIDDQSLRQTLHEGNQRQRAAAALELGLREPSKPLLEVRAPGFRQ